MVFVRPEELLLIRCLEDSINPKSNCLADFPESDIDWDYTFALATRNRVTPLVYRSLSRSTTLTVPPAALDRFKTRVQFNIARNQYLQNELLNLLRLFEHHKIDVIPLKGPVLAESLYGDLALREFRDLDVLVRQPALPHAKQVLLEAGYQMATSLNHAQESNLLKTKHNYHLISPQGVSIELHWALADQHLIFWAHPHFFWALSTEQKFHDLTVFTPEPEILLLYLCTHGALHRWIRLTWLCDIGKLILNTHAEFLPTVRKNQTSG
jgi:hypothetical protein